MGNLCLFGCEVEINKLAVMFNHVHLIIFEVIHESWETAGSEWHPAATSVRLEPIQTRIA